MKNDNLLYYSIPSDWHKILQDLSDVKKLPVTKLILSWIFSGAVNPIKIYHSAEGTENKRGYITLSDRDFLEISEIAKSEKVSASIYIRLVVYTYLINNEFLK